MTKSRELDKIRSDERAAFSRKYTALKKYQNMKERVGVAYGKMQGAWNSRIEAKEKMDIEFDKMQISSDRYNEVWSEYGKIRDQNNAVIESLMFQADFEHIEMKRCFEWANREYERGEKSMASVYSQEGRDHKARRDELNAEVGRLCQEIKNARQDAERRALKTDSSLFKLAKAKFEEEKEKHEETQMRFRELKDEMDKLKDAFILAKNDYRCFKLELKKKVEEVRVEREQQDEV